MEILLLQDVPGVGKMNDLLVVGDGYALNYLLPHRKALVATPTVRKRYAEQIRRRAEEKLTEQHNRAGVASALAGKKVVFSRKATKAGKLYAAITVKHIAEALGQQHQLEVLEDAIELSEHIKALGTFSAKVHIGDASQDVDVEVSAAA